MDATQSVGVLPFDVEKVKPDFMAASMHKHLFGSCARLLLVVEWRGAVVRAKTQAPVCRGGGSRTRQRE